MLRTHTELDNSKELDQLNGAFNKIDGVSKLEKTWRKKNLNREKRKAKKIKRYGR